MVQAIAFQLDRCDVCGKKVHRRDLVRTQVEFLAVEANNYLLYSSYNSSGWAIDDAADAGVISTGPFADQSRVRISDDNTLTEILGSQTMTGAGTVRTTDAVDCSSWDSLVFAIDCGPYQQSTSPETTFVLGQCDGNGAGKETFGTFVSSGNARHWATVDVVDLSGNTSSVYFCVTVTPGTGQSWWVDRAQVDKDATTLRAFVPTSGSSVDRADTTMMTMRKVCVDCRERILSKTERRGKIAEIRTDQPVAISNQEF